MQEEYGQDATRSTTFILESLFFVLFLIDYILTIYSEPSKKDYIFSFQGIVDLLSLLPVLNLLEFSGSIAIISFRFFLSRSFLDSKKPFLPSLYTSLSPFF